MRSALLVTAEDDQADHLLTLLGDEAVDVSHCRGTRDAFRVLRDTNPDLVIIDFDIPDGGALAVRRLSETMNPQRPVVLLVPPEIEPEWLLLFDCSRELEQPVASEQIRSVLQDLGLVEESEWFHEPTIPEEFQPLPGGVEDVSPRDFDNIRKELPPELRSKPRILYRMKPRSELADSVGGSGMSSPKAEVGAEDWAGEGVRTSLDLASDLSITNFPTLLYKLFANQMTGVLNLAGDDNSRTVYVRDGVPVFAVSELHSDAFARFIVRNRLLSQQEAQEAEERLVPGQSLPELLAKDGKLSEEALDTAIRQWVREVLIGCFKLTSGQYEFERDNEWFGTVPEYHHNPIKLIAEGIRDTMDTNQLASDLNEQLDQYLVKTEKYHEFLRFFPASEMEWHWIDAIDGTRTLRDLTVDATTTVVEFLSLVYALQAADIIDFEDRPRRIPARSKRKPEPAITKSRALSETTSDSSGEGPREDVLETRTETPAARFDQEPPALEPRPSDDVRDSYIETAEMEAVVVEYLKRISSTDAYYLLDIPQTAAIDDVRVAYERFRTRLPIEFVPLLSPAAQKNAHRIREAIHKAYNEVLTGLLKASFEAQRTANAIPLPPRSAPPMPGLRPYDTIPPLSSSSPGDSIPPADTDYVESLKRAARRGREKAKAAEKRLSRSGPGLDPGEGKRTVQGYAEAYFNEAKRLVNRRQWEKALATIKEASDILPHNAAVITLEAWIMFNLPSGNKDKRLDVCSERLSVALTLAENYADAHYYLGVVREAQRRYAEALQCFRAVLKLDPDTRFKAVHKQIKILQKRGADNEG